jgi:hypothetical protein
MLAFTKNLVARLFSFLIKNINIKTAFKKFKINFFRIASIGTVSTHVNSSSTVVNVTDTELNSLLEVVFREIGNSNVISLSLLQSLGLDTPTVIAHLQNLGYIISFLS